MKITILNITGGGISGGYRKYLQNIVPRMAINPDVESILCVSPKSINVQDWVKSLSNVKFVDCQPFRFWSNKIDSKLKHHLERFSPDVIFIPVERFFSFNNIPVVNMVLNMEPLIKIDGNPLKEDLRNWIQRKNGKRSLKQSSRIIAPSQYVRNFLIKHWQIAGEKISLIYLGTALPEKDISRPKGIPEKWDNQFLFTAGSIRPARGLEDLLYAFKYLSDDYLNIPNLVIAGETIPSMRKYKERLENWIQKNNLFSKIYWVGNLNKKEMGWCYKNCQLFVMTSRVESFGMIAAEAVAHGCLCISSNSSCLPEILDKAAVFYPTQKPEILAKQIYEVLNWPEKKKQEMRRRALARASQFSWDKCAKQTVAELKKAISDFSSH